MAQLQKNTTGLRKCMEANFRTAFHTICLRLHTGVCVCKRFGHPRKGVKESWSMELSVR